MPLFRLLAIITIENLVNTICRELLELGSWNSEYCLGPMLRWLFTEFCKALAEMPLTWLLLLLFVLKLENDLRQELEILYRAWAQNISEYLSFFSFFSLFFFFFLGGGGGSGAEGLEPPLLPPAPPPPPKKKNSSDLVSLSKFIY